jgi:hypothetical protein
MLVSKNNIIVRTSDKTAFEVIAANLQTFTVCKLDYSIDDFKWIKDYSLVMSFSNNFESLEKLGFVKI